MKSTQEQRESMGRVESDLSISTLEARPTENMKLMGGLVKKSKFSGCYFVLEQK